MDWLEAEGEDVDWRRFVLLLGLEQRMQVSEVELRDIFRRLVFRSSVAFISRSFFQAVALTLGLHVDQ